MPTGLAHCWCSANSINHPGLGREGGERRLRASWSDEQQQQNIFSRQPAAMAACAGTLLGDHWGAVEGHKLGGQELERRGRARVAAHSQPLDE